jgi:hypothetical protein
MSNQAYIYAFPVKEKIKSCSNCPFLIEKRQCKLTTLTKIGETTPDDPSCPLKYIY